MADIYPFEEEKKRNYYDWRKRQNIIGPIESYESWKSRKVKHSTATPKTSTSKKTVKPEKVGDEILAAVSEYVINIEGAVEEMLLQVASDTVKELKKISPVYEGKNKKTPKGKYRKGWRMASKMTATGRKATVYNTNYQLTHLLENQHLNRDGTTFSKAIPHISVAAKHAKERLNKLLEGL